MLPVVGQLTQKKYTGVTILENNLSKVPVFVQRPNKTDFLLICEIKNGQKKFYLRSIRSVYVAGQIQPKKEVYCPYSRNLILFQRKLLSFYI